MNAIQILNHKNDGSDIYLQKTKPVLVLRLKTTFYLTGPNGEPKITHGHTLVSELSLREVAAIINVRFDYVRRLKLICTCYRIMPSICQFILSFFHWRIIVLKTNR